MLIVTSTAQAIGHGVFGIERTPPAVIRPVGASVDGIVDQFPWGPSDSVYTVLDPNDFASKFAPPGMSRTGGGYMAISGKAWPLLKVVRAIGLDAVIANATIPKTGPTDLFTVTLKYAGSAGNDVSWTTSAATDGDANHFNLLVSITGASGTTQDKFENINFSAVGTTTIVNCKNCYLVGSVEPITTGVPIFTSDSFADGDDGTIDGPAYVGTQGSNDVGISLFETDKSIDFVFTGDPGDSLRAAVNAGLSAHADYMTDRMAFINGDSGMSLADVQTDVQDYRSLRVCYEDNWAYQRDDVDGTERLVGPAPFAVSVASNLSPSTSFSWKATEAQRFMSAITRLETKRGVNGAYTNEQQGINTLQREDGGGYTFESAVVTAAPNEPSKRKYKRTRMTHYIAKSIVGSLRPYVDSPNVPENQNSEIQAVFNFLDQLKRNAKTNPNALPHIVDFTIRDIGTFNSQTDIDNGQFTIPADIKISSDQEKIFVSMQIGESVTITPQL